MQVQQQLNLILYHHINSTEHKVGLLKLLGLSNHIHTLITTVKLKRLQRPTISNSFSSLSISMINNLDVLFGTVLNDLELLETNEQRLGYVYSELYGDNYPLSMLFYVLLRSNSYKHLNKKIVKGNNPTSVQYLNSVDVIDITKTLSIDETGSILSNSTSFTNTTVKSLCHYSKLTSSSYVYIAVPDGMVKLTTTEYMHMLDTRVLPVTLRCLKSNSYNYDSSKPVGGIKYNAR